VVATRTTLREFISGCEQRPTLASSVVTRAEQCTRIRSQRTVYVGLASDRGTGAGKTSGAGRSQMDFRLTRADNSSVFFWAGNNKTKPRWSERFSMSVATSYPHIRIDEEGTARLGRTRYKVLHLAGEHYHYGWTAEELLRQHPDLRPEEGYAVLAFFYDHFDELVAQMNTQEDELAALRPQPTLSRAELLRRRKGVA
jgi:uncharacterized protein (DUF433 family)